MDFNKKKQFQISKVEISGIAEYMKAIAHPMRLKVLNTLSLEGMCDFSRLKKLTKLSKTALANHLSQLESLRLIDRVERGHYEITEDGENLILNNIALYKKSQFSGLNINQSIGQQYLKSISSIKKLKNQQLSFFAMVCSIIRVNKVFMKVISDIKISKKSLFVLLLKTADFSGFLAFHS